MTTDTQDTSEIIQEEASQWFARLRGGDVTPDTERAFAAWVKQSPKHQAAFNQICVAWEVLGALPKSRRPRARSRYLGRREILGGAMAAGIAGYFLLHAGPAEAKVYQTSIGEQRRFKLSDGSGLFLDTASEVSVLCDDKDRSATLACGRAHFEVAGHPDRAFLIQAGGISVTSRKGTFDVFRAENATIVFLQRNDAIVQTTGGARFQLEAGQRLTISAPHGKAIIDRPPAEALIAWQRGILVFDRTTLSDAVREMNRYSRVRLSVADTKAAQLKISGAYGAGKAAEFLHSITLLLPVHAEMRNGAYEITAS